MLAPAPPLKLLEGPGPPSSYAYVPVVVKAAIVCALIVLHSEWPKLHRVRIGLSTCCYLNYLQKTKLSE